MPVTFSSFGDIVGVLQLAWQLRAALSEATGASVEIRQLLIDVDSFTRTLQHIKASIEQRGTPLAPSVAHGVRHAVVACHAVLRAILIKLGAFKTRMASKIGVTAWRQYWAVAAWSILGGRCEVDALRTRLSEQLGVIQTYLALSHATDQSAIQNAVERQATTLERVYSVVQDIQLRFDVGVPTFQFYDEVKKEYYQPFARTSLSRFLQLLELGLKRTVSYDIQANDSDPVTVHQTLAKTQTQCVIKHQLIYPKFNLRWKGGAFDCCYFRERAFGQWQVLIGRDVLPLETLRLIKHLVERRHALKAACNCEGLQCKVLFREEIQRTHYARDMVHTLVILNQMTALGLAMEPDAARRHYQMCKRIFRELRRIPERSYLRHTIRPLLELHVEHRRPSGECIVRLLRNSPLSGIRLNLASERWPLQVILPLRISPQWPSASWDAEPGMPVFHVNWQVAPILWLYV